MPIIVGPNGPIGDPRAVLRWLESLSTDIDRLAAGAGRTRAELRRAPLLASARFVVSVAATAH
jgi:hypothetical protein